MKYEYWTDSESMEFDADSDEQAIEFARKESGITDDMFKNGATLTVYGSDGGIIYNVE